MQLFRNILMSFFILFLVLLIFNFQIYNLPFNFFIFLFLFFTIPFVEFKIEKYELLFIYFFVLGLILFYENDDIDGLRFTRTIISIIVIRIIFYNFLHKYNYWRIFYFSLFIHNIVVLISFFYPNLVELIGPFFGFEKDVKIIRFPGLTSGYDLSGLVVLTSIIILDNYRIKILGNKNILKYIFLFSLSIISLLLTSRFTIIYFFIYIIVNLFYNNYYRYLFLFLTIFSIYLFSTVSGLFDAILMTLNLIDKDSSNFFYDFLILNYSQTSNIEDITSSHYVLQNNSLFEYLFGFSTISQRSDVGFINYISNYGLMNFILILYLYFKYLSSVLKFKISISENKVFYFIFILYFIGTFKNNYIFSRTSFEIFYFVYLFVKFDYSSKYILVEK